MRREPGLCAHACFEKAAAAVAEIASLRVEIASLRSQLVVATATGGLPQASPEALGLGGRDVAAPPLSAPATCKIVVSGLDVKGQSDKAFVDCFVEFAAVALRVQVVAAKLDRQWAAPHGLRGGVLRLQSTREVDRVLAAAGRILTAASPVSFDRCRPRAERAARAAAREERRQPAPPSPLLASLAGSGPARTAQPPLRVDAAVFRPGAARHCLAVAQASGGAPPTSPSRGPSALAPAPASVPAPVLPAVPAPAPAPALVAQE